MHRGVCSLLAIASLLLLSSCAKPTGGQHATVQMRDGTSVSGTVISNSSDEVKIAGDDKVTHTIPMSQVRAIEYSDAAEPVAAPPAPGAPASASAPENEPEHHEHRHPTEAAITSKTYMLRAGTSISVRNEDTIDSGKAVEGQTFPAEVTKDVLDAAGNVVIPRGSNALIVIRSATKGGKIRGSSDLVLDLASVSIDGRQYQLNTADLEEKGHSGVGANRRTGEFAGGGAAVGAIIGAIAGGGKGAAVGAGSGAGAGALTQILTKGTIKVPVETVLTFQLDNPLRVRAAE
ncbi:MAG TPA: hypothetical protein VG096_11410 [Bryobacteraceae bacterium]|jgi:hypothetical protein|nr:hypothetical protein [Bryobacteraceae bacterium]